MKNFFKTFKEELFFIPLIFLAFFALNWLLSFLFPNSAFFDFFSQLETIAFRIVSFVVALSIAWFGLRIAFPQMFRYLKDEFYHKFDTFDDDTKRKYAVRFFLVFVICVALVSRSVGGERETRSDLVKALDSQLNIRETSPNRGPMVDVFLRSVGVTPPAPWCGGYVGYNLSYFHIPNPNSAWSPDYANPKDIIWKPKKGGIKPLPGDVFTLYYSSLRRVGHVGFYIGLDKSGYFIIQAGNTNAGGSREGEGVGRKKIEPGKIYAISRYIR